MGNGAGDRPAVRINQLGYLPAGPKRAVWVSDAREPAPFSVRDRRGADGVRRAHAAVAGASRADLRPGGARARFLGPAHRGRRLHDRGRTARAATRSHRPDLYRGLVRDALGFFYLQRSGVAIDDARAPGYGAPGRPSRGRERRGVDRAGRRAAVSRLVVPGRFDVSGGWYDAGDHGKYVTSGAMPVWQLLATVELLRRRGAHEPMVAETEALLLEECRWQLDWLLRMQVPAGTRTPAWRSTACTGREWAPLPCWPHRGSRPRGCCTAPRPPPRCTWRRRPRTARACSRTTPPTPGGCSMPRWPPTEPRTPSRCSSRRTMPAHSAVGRTATTTSTMRAPGRPPSSGWPRATRPTRTTRCGRDAFDLAGFDWNRMAAAGGLDLALHGHDAAAGRVVAAAGRLMRAAGRPALGPALRARGRLGLGLQRAHARQPRRARDRPRADRAGRVPRCRDARHRLPARPQRARAELRHRLRDRLHAPPAHPPLRA